MILSMYVKCKGCGEDHSSDQVKFLNIEENDLGQDVLYFVCPVTGEETSSLVYST